jgi:polyphosphate kinase
MDLKSYSRWHDYTRARDEMFLKTDTAWAPWRVARSDDKKRARLNIITDLLNQIPYEKTHYPKIELPKRDKARGYVEYDYASKLIPRVF